MGGENPLPLCSLQWQHFLACELLWVPQVLVMLHPWAPEVTSAPLEKLFFQPGISGCALGGFGGTEFGREKHLQPSSPAWQA